jgi:thiosulfate dehydrogenase [quinone] large subunit
MEQLAALPATAISNDFAYNRFKVTPYGLSAEMGASATIALPMKGRGSQPSNCHYL